MDRLTLAREAMHGASLNAMLVTNIHNIRWLSGFSGSSAVILLTDTRQIFLTDSRYTSQAGMECKGWDVFQIEKSYPDEIADWLREEGITKLGFDSDHISWRNWKTYTDTLGSGVEFTPCSQIIENLRMIKDPKEIKIIRDACRVADKAFEGILPFIRPSVTERDVMLELEWSMRKMGADVAFDSILASGPRSSLPHGHATNRILREGDFVTMDFGAKVDGYCSDITRTVVLTRANKEQRKVYRTVLEALNKAIQAIKPGVLGKDIDFIARNHIRTEGYGSYFGHGLGHSIGLEVHDGHGFSPKSETVMKEGMILTVEPGIYIPDWGGVRIEQDVLVTSDGHKVLTRAATRMIIL